MRASLKHMERVGAQGKPARDAVAEMYKKNRQVAPVGASRISGCAGQALKQ